MLGFLLKELALMWGILLLGHIGFADYHYGASSVPISRIDTTDSLFYASEPLFSGIIFLRKASLAFFIGHQLRSF